MDYIGSERMLRVRKHAQLQAREPALLNLPIDLPSIPVLDPILTPLVAGNNQAVPSNSDTPPPAQTPSTPPADTPTPTQTPPTQNTPPPPPPASTGGGGTSVSSPAGGNNEGSGSGSSGSGGSPANNNGSGGDSNGSGGSGNSNGGGSTGIPLGASPSNTGAVTHTSGYVGGSGNTETPGSNDGGNASGQGPTTVNAAAKHGLSSGALAGIAIGVILFLALIIVILVRRRYRTRRDQRRQQWLAYGNTPGANSLPRSGVSSARSSFASPDVNNPLNNTSSIFMAEEPRAPTQMSEIALPPVAVVVEHAGGPNNRGSVYSIGSDASSHSSNSDHYVYLTPASASTATAMGPPASPISVRPFTPSEAWNFPKPPVPATSGAATSPDEAGGNFASVETIMRPFVPTMPDELGVVPGDFIRIKQLFDDGWALVEKFGTKGNTFEGLIPIDCLRPAGEQLPSFIASKRVSSYGTDGFKLA